MYICKYCGKTYNKWQGVCNQCGNWNTIEEQEDAKKEQTVSIESLKKLLSSKDFFKKIPSHVHIIDEIIAGGFVKGQTLLLAGEPGIGKSTLALQIAAASRLKTVYVSGEETPVQIAERARRIVTKNEGLINILYSTNTNQVTDYILDNKPELVIVDSIQTITTPEVGTPAGFPTQVRESAYRLVTSAKKTGSILILIGQITKSGTIAGPKTLEHLVDTVIYLEGDKSTSLRIGKCRKNRFGKTGSVSVFNISEKGVQEVKSPSSAFLSDEADSQIGLARTIVMEGTLPIAIELQSLSSFSSFSFPKRVVRGIDLNKALLILGIVEKYTRVDFNRQDVYINVGGGISVKEPGVDLAIAVSLISSFFNIPLPPTSFYIGELELSGRVRKPRENKERINTAMQCGAKEIFTGVVGKSENYNRQKGAVNIVELKSIKDLQKYIRKV